MPRASDFFAIKPDKPRRREGEMTHADPETEGTGKGAAAAGG